MSCPVSQVLASSVDAREPHAHHGGVCPLTGNTHTYCGPQPGDLRSPCPALNTLANHGYLRRDGKKIDVFNLIKVLKEVYNLSTVLASAISFGGFLVLAQFRDMSLADFARHNLVEHDASLFHGDAYGEDEYAPTHTDASLVEVVLKEGGRYRAGHMTLEDVANIRVKRERYCRQLSSFHAELGRGEMSIAFGVFGGKSVGTEGLDLDVLRLWIEQERLPDGWMRPDHTHGLYRTLRMSTIIRRRMDAIKGGKMPNVLTDDSTEKELAKTR